MRCSYCSDDIKRGTGILFVYRTGNTSYFCSNRCFKNDIILGRKINPKLVKRRSGVNSAAAQKAQAAAQQKK